MHPRGKGGIVSKNELCKQSLDLVNEEISAEENEIKSNDNNTQTQTK